MSLLEFSRRVAALVLSPRLRRIRFHGVLWSISPFKRPPAYGGCTLKPVVGVAIFWPLGRPELADSVSSSDGEADIAPHG